MNEKRMGMTSLHSAVATTAIAAAMAAAWFILGRRRAALRKPSPAPKPDRRTSYFLSGVMGGSGGGGASLAGIAVESQDYRALMRGAILAADPSATIVDPAIVVPAMAPGLHPPSTPEVEWWSADVCVRQAFEACVDLAARSDVIISYLPTASMGSAVELHAARQAGRLVLVVAPGKMRGNWVVRSYADHVFEDVRALEVWLLERAGGSGAGGSGPGAWQAS